MARRAVQRVAAEAAAAGVQVLRAAVASPQAGRRLDSVAASGGALTAGTFVFACGPWLPRLFPDVLGTRIFATRQEVFYFGTRPGDLSFAPPAMPVWIDFPAEFYALPDIEGKGLKFGLDRHGPPIDVDADDRLISPETFAVIRELVGRRLPALRDAPIVGTEVCAYENTSTGDFVIDRHPELENVWLVGGGSGHGFKHGPAVGEYVADRVSGRRSDRRPFLARDQVRREEPRDLLRAWAGLQREPSCGPASGVAWTARGTSGSSWHGRRRAGRSAAPSWSPIPRDRQRRATS